MTSHTPPDPTAYIRTRDAYLHLVQTFNKSLPPIDGPPEAAARRLTAMIERVAGMCPVNQAEAAMAAQCFAADAQASDAMRQANDPATDPVKALKCVAQAASMMRQSQAAMRTLLKMQSVREKRDAQQTTANAAAWSQHIAAAHMTETPPAPQPPPPEPDAAPVPKATVELVFYEPTSVEPELTEEEEWRLRTEQYELIYPERVALIRRHRGVPGDVSFGPPDPEIVERLLAASPAKLAA